MKFGGYNNPYYIGKKESGFGEPLQNKNNQPIENKKEEIQKKNKFIK